MTRTTAARSSVPRWSLAAMALSVVAIWVTAALGPSAAVAPLPGPGLGPLPPYFPRGSAVSGTAAAETVSALLAVGVLSGAAGLIGSLRALAHGWCPPPRRLLAAGALAVVGLAAMPPVGSADPKSYAAYGRMVATGADPYLTTPRSLGAAGDPVGSAVEPPWQDTPSVYGPLATAEQALVARVAGPSPRAAVGLLGIGNALAFLATGALLQRLAGSIARRRRLALLWSVNPLVLFQLVAGAHLDTLVAFAVIAALSLAHRPDNASTPERSWTWVATTRVAAAGLAGGAAAAIKPPGGAVTAALAWHNRSSPIRLAGAIGGAAGVLGIGYVIFGTHALDPVRRASRMVSLASPWRPLTVLLDDHVGAGLSRTLIALAALLVTVVLMALFSLALPGRDEAALSVARTTLALTLAYLLAAPYLLPWYAGTGWALLALLPASGFDRILVTYTTVLSLAYIPGRDVELPPILAGITSSARSDWAPYLLMALLLWAVLVARQALQRPTPLPRGGVGDRSTEH